MPNMSSMTATIYEGELDSLLLRPLSAQLLVSLRQIQSTGLLRALPGMAVVVYSLQALEHTPSVVDTAMAAALLLCGLTIVYALCFMSMTLEFWFHGLWSWVSFVPNIFSFAQYPAGIYTGAMKVLFLTAIPVILVANVPTLALLGDWSLTTALHSAGLAAVMLWLTRLQWRYGLRRYTSASS